jgi:uncharacterized repeat protein (TIGR01451 family)
MCVVLGRTVPSSKKLNSLLKKQLQSPKKYVYIYSTKHIQMKDFFSSVKKSLLVFCATIAAFSAQAQWVSIPDTNFGKWLNTNGYNMCLQGNSISGWQMDTTCNELVSDTTLDCSNIAISNIDGIQYFDSLKKLRCNLNNLSSLPVLPATLVHLNCSNNKLESLPALPSSLTYLDCSINELTLLPNLPVSLIHLDCFSNYLTTLALPNFLTYLRCSDNQLASLPPLPNSLTHLYCFTNHLTSLPVLPNSLTLLWCDGNQLESLPALPNVLTELRCGNNKLTSLPSLPDSLTELRCSHNPLLSCLPKLGIVKSLVFSGTKIICLPNYPQQNAYSQPLLDTIPLCNPFNPNSCDVFHNISGNVFFDSIQNCVKDVSEMNGNVKVMLYKKGELEQQSSTFTLGSYTFDTDLDTFEVRIDTAGLPYTIACPSYFSHTSVLTPQDSFDTDNDFGLRCKPGFDLGVFSAVRVRGVLFPAQIATFRIKAGDIGKLYGLNCISGIGGQMVVTYSGPATYSSSAVLTPTVTGNTLTYNIVDFSALNINNNGFELGFRTDTFAQIGALFCLTITVIPDVAGDINITNNTLRVCSRIVNSMDPNMKEVSPVNTIAPDEDWLTYTIHFQNMGNAPAIHIYVMDTLDNNVDESSIQILGSSHRMLTEIKGNIARFNFPNINLIDSATNEPESKGWLQYKIKKNSNLALGTQIKNTASIYFDFNAPVVTNTVTNTVEQPNAVKESREQMSDISVFPNPTNDVVYISYASNTSAEVTLFNMNGAVCLQQQLTATHQSISLSGLPSGVYFVSVAAGGNVVRKKVVKW